MLFLDPAACRKQGERKTAKKKKKKRKRAGELADPKTLTPRTHLAAAAAMADGGGEGGPPAAAAALKDQGNEQFKAGSYLKAAALYTQAIKLDPDNATLYRFLALPRSSSFSAVPVVETLAAHAPVLRLGEATESCGLGVSDTRGDMRRRTRVPAACVITD